MTGQLNERSLLQMKITIFSIILDFYFGLRTLNAGLFTISSFNFRRLEVHGLFWEEFFS